MKIQEAVSYFTRVILRLTSNPVKSLCLDSDSMLRLSHDINNRLVLITAQFNPSSDYCSRAPINFYSGDLKVDQPHIHRFDTQ